MTNTVIESPEFVFLDWINLRENGSFLNPEFMDYAETDLTDPAVQVLTGILTDEWDKRGYRMIPIRLPLFDRIADLVWNLDTDNETDILPIEYLSREVRQAAVDRLDFDDVVTRAKLTQEYATFVRAQPDYNY